MRAFCHREGGFIGLSSGNDFYYLLNGKYPDPHILPIRVLPQGWSYETMNRGGRQDRCTLSALARKREEKGCVCELRCGVGLTVWVVMIFKYHFSRAHCLRREPVRLGNRHVSYL
jgi:hypothetical protein